MRRSSNRDWDVSSWSREEESTKHTLNHIPSTGLDVLERTNDLSLHRTFGGGDGQSQNTRLMSGSGDRGSIGKRSKGNGGGEKS